jgi:hypothetical protein
VTANQGRTPVQHDYLAVIALVEHANVAKSCRVVGVEFAAGLLEPAHGDLAHLPAAGGIDQHAHRDPGAAPLRQRVDEPLPEHAVLPQVRLEMNRPRCPADLVEHDLEKSPILQNLDRVAVERGAVGQAGERRQQLGKRRVAFDAQTRIAVALDRPDDDPGKKQSAAKQRDDDSQKQIGHCNCLSCSSVTQEDCSMLSPKQEHWGPARKRIGDQMPTAQPEAAAALGVGRAARAALLMLTCAWVG